MADRVLSEQLSGETRPAQVRTRYADDAYAWDDLRGRPFDLDSVKK
ncbi:hypothetical protein [Methylobacterium nodulans]|uniref:Uncharacterized protein n=1 Tax=Methylobacterium nodulans (strain LMG 21967 / CNCM I-2342 / ORS 2060) TaxID=460265 RepID=B8IG20_METNO|nr:hypothetical protein [Methylobacterium nodulans]ACL61497.1 hypothetical protein Mnod_6739 [Methylobacterium nodulans ORS 2060]